MDEAILQLGFHSVSILFGWFLHPALEEALLTESIWSSAWCVRRTCNEVIWNSGCCG